MIITIVVNVVVINWVTELIEDLKDDIFDMIDSAGYELDF